jgi:hypothetical protein
MQYKHTDQLPRRHTFTPTQKSSYLSAELCLMHTPARQNLTGALTLFDELAASHQSQSPYMHFVGAFLPWHRALIWAHETALRTRCNYTGAQPYWAEERDAGAFATSEILAEFGGDGVGEEGCIAAGPFANYTSSIGPGRIRRIAYRDRSMRRLVRCRRRGLWMRACGRRRGRGRGRVSRMNRMQGATAVLADWQVPSSFFLLS